MDHWFSALTRITVSQMLALRWASDLVVQMTHGHMDDETTQVIQIGR